MANSNSINIDCEYSKTLNSGCLVFPSFILLAITMLIVFLCSSCKTLQHIDKSHIEQQENTRTVIEYVHDTTFVIQEVAINTDSKASIESSSITKIDFLQGGSYNALTGECSNVSSITTDQKQKALLEQLETYKQNELAYEVELSILQDSIYTLNQSKQNDINHTEKPKNNWYWWFILGSINGLVIPKLFRLALKVILKV